LLAFHWFNLWLTQTAKNEEPNLSVASSKDKENGEDCIDLLLQTFSNTSSRNLAHRSSNIAGEHQDDTSKGEFVKSEETQ